MTSNKLSYVPLRPLNQQLAEARQEAEPQVVRTEERSRLFAAGSSSNERARPSRPPLEERYLATTGEYVTVRIDAYEQADAKRNQRRYRSQSFAFGTALLGNTLGLISLAISAAPGISGRDSTRGEAKAKLGLAIVGTVLTGVGAASAFVKAYVDDESDTGWLRSKPARGLASMLGAVAGICGADWPQEATKKRVELAALMVAWSMLNSPTNSLEEFNLHQKGMKRLNDLGCVTEAGRKRLEKGALKSILSGETPDVTQRNRLLGYHAVRMVWTEEAWIDLSADANPRLPLRERGFTSNEECLSSIKDLFKKAGVDVDMPDAEKRAREEHFYVPGGGTIPNVETTSSRDAPLASSQAIAPTSESSRTES